MRHSSVSVNSVPVLTQPADVSRDEAVRLAEAFRLFSQASDELSNAYSDLQGQVVRLTEELAVANGALRQQYQEKAALTERLSLLLDALPAGVLVLNEAGCVAQVNPAASYLLGGLKVGAGWTAIQTEILQSGDTPGEYLCNERRLAIAVTPLDSAGGRIVLLHDITEAQQLKTKAERHQRLAAMGEMAAQLAHQLRTPLAAALLYAGNLESAALPPTAQTAIAQKTVARLKHIERLIQDMLLFARGEALGRERVAVADLLAELTHNFEPLAQNSQVSLVVKDESAGAVLTGKRKSLVSALTSVLENALQAVNGRSEARIALSAWCEEDRVLLAVEDNGCGMDQMTATRVFEPFYTTRSEGTGLGLAIARGVVLAHGGSLEVVSSPDAGATFSISLPCLNS